ncbi:hypothetical protein ACIHFC_04840 [Streptomyces sp. NPDC052013]|uniref:hypothetical protein n=1 Tax=Streptomyces sp. NPDC052013 TaxID=3365679 RepID=UPI0037CE378D
MPVVEPVDDRLGALLSTHPVAGERYLRTGGAALAFALGGVLLAAFLITHPDIVAGRLLALAILPTLGGLPIAVVQLNRARRTGRAARYELYENGLAHRTAGRTRSWTWDQVASVDADPQAAEAGPEQVPVVGLGQRLGRHFRCAVRFTDGSRILVDGCTADGPAIAQALLTHRPDAVPAQEAHRGTRVLLWTMPGVIAASCVAVVLMYQYMNSNTEDDIGAGALVALALAMIVCILVFVMSLVAFVMLLIGRRRVSAGPR